VTERTALAADSPEIWRGEGWKTDFSKANVPFSEIISGGPPKDGIPSIDAPEFETVDAAERYAAREPVIALKVGETAKAYPLSVLTWHEIVNDMIAGRPVAVTYCPLCNASIVFDRRLDGQILEFGTTGKLRKSDLVMYDRQTESWWQQFTGEAIVGEFVGNKLEMIPSRVVAYSEFAERHPEGQVLVPSDPSSRNYGRNPYVRYDSRATPYPLYQGDLPEGINPMARVVVVKPDSADVIAVSLAYLREQERIEVDGVELRWTQGVASALDEAEIAKGRDVGAIEAVDAATREPLVHDVTFAFVLFAFNPDIPVLTETGRLALKPRE
jgi:hypothetical protein